MRINNLEELIDGKHLPVYKCMSINLKKFLLLNDVIFIDSYVSKKTKKTVWVFVKTKKVQALLEEWTNNNPKKARKEDSINEQ